MEAECLFPPLTYLEPSRWERLLVSRNEATGRWEVETIDRSSANVKRRSTYDATQSHRYSRSVKLVAGGLGPSALPQTLPEAAKIITVVDVKPTFPPE